MKEWLQDEDVVSPLRENCKTLPNGKDHIYIERCSSIRSKKSKAVVSPNVLFYMNNFGKSASARYVSYDRNRLKPSYKEMLRNRL